MLFSSLIPPPDLARPPGDVAAVDRRAPAQREAPAAGPAGAYLATVHRQQTQRRVSAEAALAERRSMALRASTPIGEFARRLVQMLRLCVGVHDYAQYLAHMQVRHPAVEPMTRAAFHRRCVDARYGGGSGAGSRCPC